jgi:hypothetical protein
MRGATIHASAAIGSAAAAQIAKIARLEYWGIVTLDRSTAGDGEGATAMVLSLLLWWSVSVMVSPSTPE